MTRRWNVEVKRDVFDDVGADNCIIHPSGALVFTNGNPISENKIGVAYAPGTWLTVTPQEDES